MPAIEFTFDKPPVLVQSALKHPKFAFVFRCWHVMPIVQATVDIDCDTNSIVTVAHPADDATTLHDAADLTDAFLTGYFANN